VKITDAAIVAAAVLSNRYIADRFLPDKAIDLIDEAASRLKMEIDSLPTEIDEVERKVLQAEIERKSLEKDDSASARDRLATLERSLSELREKSLSMKAVWKNEKDAIGRISDLKKKIEDAKADAERAERQGDLTRAAELRYGVLNQLARDLEAANASLEELQKDGGFLREKVEEEDVAAVVSRWTGIPVARMVEGETQKLLAMEERLKLRVIGQDEAVAAVSAAVRRARAGMNDPKKPIGSFLFLGPTGVGKTELARALAEFLFDDEAAMVRLDMSEYQEKHTVSRMIGAPPGYIGHDEGGQLTEAVRRRPYSVVLFDEIEKAHPDVWSTLLQVLDDGRLTDGKGRVVDFRNVVVVMTSNVGSQLIQDLQEVDETEMRKGVEAELRHRFRPEFLNRIDDVIVFRRLTLEEIGKIVDIQLRRVGALIAPRGVTLEWTDAARRRLAEKAFDPVYGARPLKRNIQKLVQDPLALRILNGEVTSGATLSLDANASGEGVSFTISNPSAARAAGGTPRKRRTP
jgi:ATP-dependent Clp protease ATP-binding subunit ClpB